MKKIFLFLLFLLSLVLQSFACDICGCGAGASFMGVIPQFGRSQFSLRSQYTRFDHPNTTLNFNGESQVFSDEIYNNEFIYRHFSKKRWSMFVHVPMRIHVRNESLRTTHLRGLGDINATFNYTLVNTSDSMSHRFKHVLMIGAGVKLATGKYMQRDETKLMLPARFQLGSGANDFIGQLYYTVRYRRWGLNANAMAVVAGENELRYRFGNFYQGAIGLFWKKDFTYKKKKIQQGTQVFDPVNSKTISLLPAIGFNYEHVEADKEYDKVKMYTGSTRYFGNVSLDIFMGDFAASVFYQHALYTNITFVQPDAVSRIGAAFTYSF